jgi:5-methylcytosine-specific restriction endonuclease McrA
VLRDGAAHYRKTAAELVQRFPEVLEPIREGKLCITSIVELAKVLSPENREEVLPRFFHLSKREAAEVAAAIRPDEAAPRREVVTTLRLAPPVAPPRANRAAIPSGPVETATQPVQPEEHLDANPGLAAAVSSPQPQEGPGATRQAPTEAGPLHIARDVTGHPAADLRPLHHDTRDVAEPLIANLRPLRSTRDVAEPLTTDLRPLHSTRDVAEPLTADLRRLHVTVSRRFLSKLEAARAALSHARPGATAEDILEAGLDLLLAKDAKRRGEVERPQATVRSARPDHVPARVKREVWKRDGGRCTWPLASGGVCGSTVRLQLDHVVPRARGGPSNAGNLRLLCAVHNQYAARLVFGGEWMDRYARGAAPPPDAVAPGS